MNYHKQQSNLKIVQLSTITALLLGSIATSLLNAGSAFAEPTTSGASKSLTKLAASTSVAETLKATPAKAPAKNDRIAQASDVAGNWAEPFIRVLVEKQIIAGYPDGTYRPDQPVTRAEFAALLNKAFTLTPIRSGKNFKDVPSGYWAADVIQKAYESGFLAGYPNGTFGPKQNITRIQSLVSVVNGSKLESTATNFDLNSVFADAAQVPSYGQNALIAATQKCVAVSVDYDNATKSGNFGPNTVASRADVAAYIHQILVASGRLPALDASSPAYKYIATCAKAVAMTPEEAIAKLSVPGQLPEIAAGGAVGNYPVGGLGTPTAFTGSNGIFFGAAYQNQTRPDIYGNPPNPNFAPGTAKGSEAYAYTAGVNLGDPRNFLGLEAVATTYSRGGAGIFDNGGLSFKLNKQLGDNFAIAGGYENAITFGNNSGNGGFSPDGGVNGGRTGYGVASVILNPDPSLGLFSNTTLSVGAGGGRFRQVGDIRAGRDSVNVFGSIGTRLSPNFSLVADYNGQSLGVGLPISIPFGAGSSFQVTPALVDLTNSETGGSRFVVSGGLGFQF